MGRPFTPAEDSYLIEHYGTQPLVAIAQALGRLGGSIQQRAARLLREGRLRTEDRCYRRPWTPAEDCYLSCWWGLKPDAAIAAHLRRTITACALRAKRRWHQGRKANLHTAGAVARVFGVDAKTACAWIRRGWLHGEGAPFRQGPHAVWHVYDGALETFARRLAWALDAERMDSESYLTTLVREAQAADPCLTVEAAAREVGYHPEILRKHVRAGLLPHRRRPRLYSRYGPWQGQIVVRRADLAPYLARLQEQKRANRCAAAQPRPGTVVRGWDRRTGERWTEVAAQGGRG